VQKYLLRDYDHSNIQNPVALRVSFLLYCLGTLILAVLLLHRSLHVFGLTWSIAIC
jgi:hypothetical protein